MNLPAVGLQKTSLVDYPGRVAAVFFLPGCNFSCPYCHNPGLVSAVDMSALVLMAQAFDHLKRRAGLITALVISGGEPTLHPGLSDLVSEARALGLLVKLDTNGSFPDRLTATGADYIAMDLKTDPERYPGLWPHAPADAASRIRESLAVVRSSGAAYEFRITCAPGIFGPDEAEAVAGLLKPGDPVFLQAYRPGRVLDQAWAAGVRPYVDSEMDGLLEIIRKRAPLARIRGSDPLPGTRAGF
jgi:pyruvate formate lyase activating enzyme